MMAGLLCDLLQQHSPLLDPFTSAHNCGTGTAHEARGLYIQPDSTAPSAGLSSNDVLVEYLLVFEYILYTSTACCRTAAVRWTQAMTLTLQVARAVSKRTPSAIGRETLTNNKGTYRSVRS
ncbi:unnamed protein product [Laminaria digitata]